jgi:hypothetical protein
MHHHKSLKTWYLTFPFCINWLCDPLLFLFVLCGLDFLPLRGKEVLHWVCTEKINIKRIKKMSYRFVPCVWNFSIMPAKLGRPPEWPEFLLSSRKDLVEMNGSDSFIIRCQIQALFQFSNEFLPEWPPFLVLQEESCRNVGIRLYNNVLLTSGSLSVS